MSYQQANAALAEAENVPMQAHLSPAHSERDGDKHRP